MSKNYYIDTQGSDDNDGLSAATPFSSFKKINESMLLPGDKVLLKCGCIWNEQLIINGKGNADNFIEIFSYGDGPKPKIKRNGQIWDRCVRINNPSFLKFDGIEVCNGGAGIVLFYDNSYNNKSVYITNVVAHDFFGIYRACGKSSKNKEWQSYIAEDRVGFSMGICVTGCDSSQLNQERVLTDLLIQDCEIYKTGAGIGLDWCDHRNSDQTITLHNKFGDVVFDRINLHDNDVADVSLTSMFLQCVTGAKFTNSIIDNGAGGAEWGTAAVHLQLARNVLIENVVIANTPHTGASDECGIDLETDVRCCTIKNCRFLNNAGAAIEFLCNFEVSAIASSSDIVIDSCQFYNNNYAKLYEDPSQILVQLWQHDNCPSGEIKNCTYKNPDGVSFFGGSGVTSLMKQNLNFEDITLEESYETNAHII